MNKQITQIKFLVLAIFTLCALATEFKAQTTAFTYQGRFNDTTVTQPTNGTYQMQFKIYDAAQVGTGTQIENTVTIPAVQVVSGIFTVQLDFGDRAFNNSNRFIEISVQPVGGAGYTTLAPRQPVTNAPLAIRSLSADFATSASNAVQLGGVAASNYRQNNDARLSNDRNPLAGSENYIQNQNAALQSADFKIGGSGTVNGFFTAGSVNTGTNYKINTQTVFGTPNSTSTVAGQSANYNITGGFNTFIGYRTGAATNASTSDNTFVGSLSGQSNITGLGNTFVGSGAGTNNTNGSNNSALGNSASTVGNSNIAVGYSITATGDFNTSVGIQSYSSGSNNITVGVNNFANGNNNTIIGYNADTNSPTPIINSTALGANARVTTSNTIVLGTTAETTIVPGKFTVNILGAAGSTSLCRNGFNQISTCTAGKFANPESAAMLKEISDQKAKVEAQQVTIDALKKLVCATNATADMCKEVK